MISQRLSQQSQKYSAISPPRSGMMNGERSMGRKQLKLYRQQSSYRFDEWRPWLIWCWRIHFVVCIIVVIFGCTNNRQGRKYVPIQLPSQSSSSSQSPTTTSTTITTVPMVGLLDRHDKHHVGTSDLPKVDDEEEEKEIAKESNDVTSVSVPDFATNLSVVDRHLRHLLSSEKRELSIELSPKDCQKGFVNVFAKSMDEPDAVVYCCRHRYSNNSSNYHYFLPSNSPVGQGICQPSSYWVLSLSQRLSRFPEAWIFPLFPILLRFLVVFWRQQQSQQRWKRRPWWGFFGNNNNAVGGASRLKPSGSDTIDSVSSSSSSSSWWTSSSSSSPIQQRLAKRRLYLYLFIIQFRGWILYLLLDRLEDRWISSSSTMDDQDQQQCWYQPLISNHYETCHGRSMDFSDHMVLYCAQILPIALTEVLYSFAVPYWNQLQQSQQPQQPQQPQQQQISTNQQRNNTDWSMIPMILISGALYLYVLTCAGIIKTATYFHTWQEVVCGFIVSLVVQVPLFLLQTSTSTSTVSLTSRSTTTTMTTRISSYFDQLREYFFGISMS